MYQAKSEMPISGTILEELHGKAQRGILVEVEHGKAHRTNKEKTNTSQSEKFVTEGNEKADELAKAGSDQCWMKDFWQKQKLCSKKENMKHRTDWRAEADRCRCMRCVRGSTKMKMPGKCTGPKFLTKSLENREDDIWEEG